jgi:hypothetical protein
VIYTLAPGKRRTVWQLDCGEVNDDPQARELIDRLLVRHGWAPGVAEGTQLAVVAAGDGVPWLEASVPVDGGWSSQTTRMLCEPPPLGWWADELRQLVDRRE